MQCYMTIVPDTEHPAVELAFLGRKQDFDVFNCPYCGLIQSPHPDVNMYLGFYMTSDRYFQKRVLKGYESYQDRFDHDIRVAEIRVRNLEYRMNGTSGWRLLDIGCGNGAFIKRAHKAGFDCTGVDISPYFIKSAVETISEAQFACRDLIKQDNSDLGAFDVITFHDSFEHFLDPVAYLRSVKKMMSAGVLVVVELPNADCDELREKGLEWHHVKPREHPFLYKQHHIADLFGVIGLTITDVIHTIPGRCILYLR